MPDVVGGRGLVAQVDGEDLERAVGVGAEVPAHAFAELAEEPDELLSAACRGLRIGGPGGMSTLG